MAITKVDLANVVTGVLPVANGGTGTSTGVAPGGSDRQVQFNNAGAFGGNSGFVYDSSGNLGLGVTPSAWSLGKAIQVGTAGDAALLGYGGQAYLTSNAYYNAGWKYASGTSPAVLYQQTSGYHSWHIAPSGTAGNAITFTQAMTLDASGNLLVGGTSTYSPYTKVHALNGIAVAVDTSNAGRIIGATTTGTELSYLTMGGNYNLGGTGEIALATTTAKSIILGTNNTERMRIDSSGNVGIGTSSPASDGKLSVESNGSASSEINISLINGISNKECIVNFGNNLATAGRYKGRIFYQVDNNVMGFWTNTTERMRITANGGIAFSGSTNYGSSGQVLTSNGDAAPTWGSVSGTAKAWVNFNGSGGGIRASSNVSSISVNGTGRYTVNMSTAQTDANYARIITASGLSSDGNGVCSNTDVVSGNSVTATTTAFGILLTISGQSGYRDSPYVSAAVFR